MLEKEDWLSEETREKAIEKLDNMHSNVLYPDQLGDWSALDFAGPEEGGSLLGANFKILEFRDHLKAARMDTAVDRNEWDQILSPADTVNCNYTSQNNTMNIMAAFADGEFYRDGMSYEQMLGGIGFVIAHEISHAFDTQGAKYDKDGSLSDWWTAEDYAAFQKRADRLAEWFDGFIPVEGVNYDGMGVRREVIADMAAMKCLLTLAAQKENFDYDAFFRQIAISQREVGTPESINYMIKFDTHPLPYMRANGTLAQYDDFLNFYGIQEGDGMYIAPEDRVAVW
jgi:putative endopeptidase